MSGVSITNLDPASTLTGSEIVPIVQSGTTVRTTLAAMPYVPAGTGAVTTSVQTKLRETVSVKDFGAVGDGTTDDTAAIQAAINSSAKQIIFPSGYTYIIDGGLISNIAGQVFTAYGATIKLKASATTKGMLRLNGIGSSVFGGTWDGNKANGNATGSTYDSYNVAMYADQCTVKDIVSINTYGMAIKGFGNYLSALNNNISNTGNYGIYFDGSASVSHTGNRAIGNTIDMSDGIVSGGANQGQGILFTAGTGQEQKAWELSSNNIIGPQTSVTSQAINLAVRGNNGLVVNNITRYGAMGFSEGGSNTVIDGNRFLDVTGTTAYGIESTGANVVITNNVITGAITGIIGSSTTMNNWTVTGNNISASSNAIKIQVPVGGTAYNTVIAGNYLQTSAYGIFTARAVKNLTINGNVIVGPSATFASGRGVYLDTPETNAYVFVSNNTIVNVERPYAIYSASAVTFNYLFATGNNLSLAGANLNSSIWNIEGSATVGTPVVSNNNVNPSTTGAEYSAVNQGSNIVVRYGTGSPQSVITAGIGSIYINKSGGASTTLYVKESGTGNTGWVAK